MTDALCERWGLPDLQHELQRVEPGLTLEVVASIGSTNTALLERAGAARAAATALASAGHGGQDAWTSRLLVAQAQTQGRGRQGRAWHAQPGASLTFSLGLSLAPRDWSGLSLAVGVALADALDPVPGLSCNPHAEPAAGAEAAAPRILLKWPNDLWLRDARAPGGGRKLGGVLIETTAGWADAAHPAEGGAQPASGAAAGPRPPQGPRTAARICVIGVGLNIGPPSAQALAQASSGMAWLQEMEPRATAAQALARVAGPLLQAVRRFESASYPGVAQAFARRDLLRGQPITTTLPDLPVGTAQGVDDSGALQVQTPDGAVHSVVGGEVSIRLRQGDTACA